MVARSSQTDQGLQAQDVATRMKAVRDLKNSIIGNRFKKLQHLHVVPWLVDMISNSVNAELQVQAISTLGSLAYGVEDGVRAIIAAGGVHAIVNSLGSSDGRVTIAAARSLKLLYQSPLAPHEPLLAAATLQRLVHLVKDSTAQSTAASVLAHCCINKQEASKVVAAGAVSALSPLLFSCSRSCQEAALGALAVITQHSDTACKELLAAQPPSVSQQQQHQVTGCGLLKVPSADGGGSSSKQAAASTSRPMMQDSSCQKRESAVVLQLLQLCRQRDAQLRCLVAKCVCNLTSVVASGQSSEQLHQELLHAARVVLPQMVRLLPAAAAVASHAAETLEFITQHTHHPHFPPFAAAPLGKAAGARGETLEGFMADHGPLLAVPKVLEQLIGEREELIELAVELDAVKQLMGILAKTTTAAAAAASRLDAGNHEAASLLGAPESLANGSAAGSCNGSGSSHQTAALAAAAAAKKARAAAAAAAARAAAAGVLQLRAGSLEALAGLAVGSEPARQQMVDNRIVPMLLAALNEADPGVRIGAAVALRGLSRSVRILRGSNLSPNLGPALVALLKDDTQTDVQAAAAAAVCNLALDFSHISEALLDADLPQALAALLPSMLPELRLRALWGFKNLAFSCSPELHQQLLQALKWPLFTQLLTADDDPRVHVQAVGLLQNLCKGTKSIDQVLQWSNQQLIPLVESLIDAARYQTVLDTAVAPVTCPSALGQDVPGVGAGSGHACDGVAVDAAQLDALQTILPGLLYTVSNICSGSEQHKVEVMRSRIPQLLLQYIQTACTAATGSTAPAAGGTGHDAAAQGSAANPGELHISRSPQPQLASQAATTAATATASRLARRGSPAACAVFGLALPAVWCVINLLWCQEASHGSGAGRTNVTDRQEQPVGDAHATAAGGDGSSSGAAARAAEAAASTESGDVTMTAADDGDDVRAAAAERAAVLRGLGFHEALTGLLEAPSITDGRVQADDVGSAAAAASSRSDGAHESVEGGTQDLLERVQTALQHLTMI